MCVFKIKITMDFRKDRALSQRLYLLDATQHAEQHWDFLVRGSSGNSYSISISNKVSCTCPDFKQRFRICKHIYFIIGRIAQNKELLDEVGNDVKVNLFLLDPFLSEKIVNRLKRGAQNAESSKTVEENITERDKTCSICYEETCDTSSSRCHSCKNIFHSECIKMWTKLKSTCPLCRQIWRIHTNVSDEDELAFMVTQLQL